MPTNKSTDFHQQPFYVGLDVHLKSWSVTVRTLGIEVAHFSQVPDAVQLAHFLHKRYPGGVFHSAYEAGFSGTAAHEQLKEAGIDNIIINPADLPQTDKQKHQKTDSHDSRSTARYLEAGVLRGIHVLSREQQEFRALFRRRQTQMKEVTRATNRIRSFMHYFSIRFPIPLANDKYLSNARLQWLRALELKTPQGTLTLQYHLDDLQYHRRQLLEVTRRLRKETAQRFPQAYPCALSVPGIGPITAMALLAESGDPSRFPQPDPFCSWLGLAPSMRCSGDTLYLVCTQPRSNTHLRPLMIEAAWVAIRRSPAFLAYYRKHVAKDNRKAIIKVAAKLAGTLRAVMAKQLPYQEPL